MGHISEGVFAEDEVEFVGWCEAVAEAAQGLDRIRRSMALYFGEVETKRRVGGYCQPHHLDSIAGRGDHATCLAPGITGRHEPDLVERELLASELGKNQMAGVNRVESAAEKADPQPTHSSSTSPMRIGSPGRAPAR